MTTSRAQNFYDIRENAMSYIEMREGIDGKYLIEVLKKHLAPNSTVLELGIGTGKDLDLLTQFYITTGSDNSQSFLDLYRKHNSESDLLLLDAATLKTDRKFNCIYSNKVLHHLSRKQLKDSFNRQKAILNKNGFLLHTFWKGNEEAAWGNLKFIKYQKEQIIRMTKADFKLIKTEYYKELIKDDSFYIILKKR